MNTTKKIADRRSGFTLVEMLVVIAIILALAALAAAFMPRVNENQRMTRAVDNLEQWLLTAKMRAKRDGLATGIRFVQTEGDAPLTFSQVQYIQQPDPLSGGWWTAAGPVGGVLSSAGLGTVTFANVDFTLGGLPLNQWLVQPGDYLEIRDGGVYQIGAVTGPNTLTLAYAATAGSYDASLTIAAPGTTNYRILRQPRILIGEEPLSLPNNYAVDMRIIPGPIPLTPPGILPNTIIPNNTTIPWSNVLVGPSGNYEILFSPSGAVVGSNAGNGTIFLTVYDMTMNPFDMNNVGIIGVQCRTGFMGAYSAPAGAGLLGYNPFYLAQIGRESGM
jgi:prepilin-type N-terminal cleavage/methylation domain-containing protein